MNEPHNRDTSLVNDRTLSPPPADDTARLGSALEPTGRALALPRTIAGYEIEELIGRGGMGVVYRARQAWLNRTVALKMVSADPLADPAALVRFRAEAEAVAQLQHPNIVQIYEIGQHDGRPFISLEYVAGGSLAQKLQRELLSLRQAAELVEILARAIHTAHERGIVHRDLKPANVLLTPDGTPKITDFGLAKRLHDASGASADTGPTRTGDILGTPSYMAPEQAAARLRDIGPRTDVYALGTILYELLAGQAPFAGTNSFHTLYRVLHEEPGPPQRDGVRIPHDLQTICLTCLHKEPARRYASAQALADDLRAFLAGEPVLAQRPGPWHKLVQSVRRRPAIALLTGCTLVAAVGLALGAWWYDAAALGAIAVLSLLLAAGWYHGRLRATLDQLRQEQLESERDRERLQLLLETTRRILSATSLDELLHLLSETTTRLANAERVTIYLVDAERGELWSKVALGETKGDIRVPLGTGIAGRVAVSGETIRLDDPYADPRFHADVDRRTGYTTRNLLTLPMKSTNSKVIGVFQVLNKRQGKFTLRDVEILTSLAASAALAVEHAAKKREEQ